MLKIRNHKLIALLLCFVMVATSVVQMPMTAFAASTTDMTIINESGDVVSEVTLVQDEKISLTVKGNSEEKVQWQIFAEEYDMWIDILGETSEECALSYAKVANMLDKKGKTKIRVSQGKGDSAQYSKDVTISVADETETIEEAPVMAKYSLKSSAKSVEETVIADAPELADKCYIIINYQFENNQMVAQPYTAEVTVGDPFEASVTFPVVQGYLPYIGANQLNEIELSYDSVQESETIDVIYRPAYVNYRVIHMKQNVEDDDYTQFAMETFTGTTGEYVPEVAKVYLADTNGDGKQETVYNPDDEETRADYTGFYSLIYEKPQIAADGSTEVVVKYDRSYYLMFFELGGGYGVEPIYAKVGTPIGTIATPTKAGYKFAGWAESEGSTKPVTLPAEMPAGKTTYYAIWEPEENAKVTVVFWGENANDEEYTYIKSMQLEAQSDTEFTLGGGTLTCTKTEHIHKDECYRWSCTKEEHSHDKCSCSHTHTTSCYATGNSRALVKTNAPSSLNDYEDQGNGIWVYEESGWVGNTYYYVKIGNDWYCGSNRNGTENSETTISYNCTHKHSDSCYDCGKESHKHDTSCYTIICGKDVHTHTSACYQGRDTRYDLDNALYTFRISDTVTVNPDGSTVVNVYYDRKEFTLTFRTGSNSSSTIYTIKEKWGSDIRAHWPIKGTNGTTYDDGQRWDPSGSDKFEEVLVYIDIMPAESFTLTLSTSNAETYIMHYMIETLPDEIGTAYNDKTFKESFKVSANYNYITKAEDFFDLEGFTQWASNPSFSGNQIDSGGGDVYFYYTRNVYDVEFYNPTELISTANDVPYQNNLGEYYFEPTPDQAPAKYEPGSVEFAGWYLNPECSGEEYILSEHTMPVGTKNGEAALSLYAKWEPVTHNVKFYVDETAMKNNQALETDGKVWSDDVLHGEHAQAPSTDELNQPYTFVGWFYIDENGNEKAFDFTNMPVKHDIKAYAKWSSNTLMNYFVYFRLQGTDIDVADPITGSALAGDSKTFYAKGGTDLYDPAGDVNYQEGYFPVVQSHTIYIDIDDTTKNIYVFEYVKKAKVPYIVRYVDEEGNELIDSKIVADNGKAVVTENFEYIEGMMPNAYQQRLVVNGSDTLEEGKEWVNVTIGGNTVRVHPDNVVTFVYKEDLKHAFYKITHYIEALDGSWEEKSSTQAVGDIGTRYTGTPKEVTGYTYSHIEYVVDGNEVTTDITDEGVKLTQQGLEINLYYTLNEYPYRVRYVDKDTNTILAPDKTDGVGFYGATITDEEPLDIDNYTYDSKKPGTLVINTESKEATEDGLAERNIITFYYTENKVTINYVAEGRGTVNNKATDSETVKVLTGTPAGAVAVPNAGYEFLGWYNVADVQIADSTQVKYVPEKVGGKHVGMTYIAKFRELPATINYEVMGVGGTVAPGSEQVMMVTGTAKGSTATPVEGYAFEGWYDSEGNKVSSNSNFAPEKSGDVWPEVSTYYAKFVEEKAVIKYKAETGGSVTRDNEEVDRVTGIAQGSVAEAAAGYYFVGWYDSGNNKVSEDEDFTPAKAENILWPYESTYTAKFVEEKATIKYVARTGGTVSPTSELVNKVTGTAVGSTASAKDGYVFKRWVDKDGNLVSTAYNFIPTKDADKFWPESITYYAEFEEAESTLNYAVVNNIGGTVTPTSEKIKTVTGVAKGSVAAPADGYRFVGWYGDSNGTGKLLGSALSFAPTKADGTIWENGKTFYAKFEEKTATINYVVKDGIGGTVDPAMESVPMATGEASGSTATELEGYEFAGWYDNADCTGEPISTSKTFVPGKAENAVWPETSTYYAKFVENEVKLYYVPVTEKGTELTTGSTEGGDVSVKEESVLISTGTPGGATAAAEPDFEFAGWYSDAECNNKISTDAEYVPTKAEGELFVDGTKYYAKFVEKEIQINYEVVEDKSDVGQVNPISETVKILTGEAQGSTAKVLDETYAFVGWYSDRSCEEKYLLTRDYHFTPQQVEGTDGIKRNVAATYYAKFEEAVTFTYIAVPDHEKGDVGTVSLIGAGDKSKTVSEQVGKVNDVPIGAAANGDPEMGFKFVGWYLDKECTQPVTSAEANVDGNEIIPVKRGVEYVGDTFYAKFSSSLPHLTINKTGVEAQDSGESFLFEVTGPDGFNTTVVIKGNGSITLKNLELGKYTVREITSWNVDYTPAENPLDADIEDYADIEAVSFANTIKTPTWLDGSVTLLNLFTPHGIEKYSE